MTNVGSRLDLPRADGLPDEPSSVVSPGKGPRRGTVLRVDSPGIKSGERLGGHRWAFRTHPGAVLSYRRLTARNERDGHLTPHLAAARVPMTIEPPRSGPDSDRAGPRRCRPRWTDFERPLDYGAVLGRDLTDASHCGAHTDGF